MLPPKTEILLVEDSPVMAEQTRFVLNSLGLKHITDARNGFEAIRQLVDARVANKKFGLIIIDYEMPKLSGIEFFQMIRTIPDWAAIPAIFLTSFNLLNNVVTAASAGVEHYLIKPATKEMFEKKLKAISK